MYSADRTAARILAEQWKTEMKLLDDGATKVLASMRYHRRKVTTPDDRKALDTVINFVARQAQAGRLKYAEARRNKRPIGTGIVEAAAKTVVNVRMKRAGARYSQHGGQTIMPSALQCCPGDSPP